MFCFFSFVVFRFVLLQLRILVDRSNKVSAKSLPKNNHRWSLAPLTLRYHQVLHAKKSKLHWESKSEVKFRCKWPWRLQLRWKRRPVKSRHVTNLEQYQPLQPRKNRYRVSSDLSIVNYWDQFIYTNHHTILHCFRHIVCGTTVSNLLNSTSFLNCVPFTNKSTIPTIANFLGPS